MIRRALERTHSFLEAKFDRRREIAEAQLVAALGPCALEEAPLEELHGLVPAHRAPVQDVWDAAVMQPMRERLAVARRERDEIEDATPLARMGSKDAGD